MLTDQQASLPTPLNLSVSLSFEAMSTALVVFNHELNICKLPLWLPLTDSEQAIGLNMRQKALNIYANIWHSGDGDGRLTTNCHGLIGASPNLIKAALALNSAKDSFRAALAELKDKDPKSINLLLHRRSQALASELHQEGLSRLHLKQCYRQVPILNRDCLKVQFSWYCSGRSIKRISQEESLEKLLKLNQSSEHIQIQISQLSNLRPGTRLAQVQNQVPIMRVNAVWNNHNKLEEETLDNQDAKWLRKARNAPLPLLIPLKDGDSLPSYNQPDLQPPIKRQRALRSDSQLELHPLLPSLRIHCYK